MSTVDQLLADLRRELRPLGWRARRAVLAEARDHLMSGIDHELAAGASPEEAERRVVERYGDPAAMARGLLLARPRKPSKVAQLLLVAVGVIAGITGTVLVAVARDFSPAKRHAVHLLQTADSIDQMQNAGARVRFLRGLVTDPAAYTHSGFPIASPLRADTPVRKLFQIPHGSVYAGHAAWVAGPPGGYQCWAAFDGGSCGTLSKANPVVAFSLSHPASDLPDVIIGLTSAEVVSMAINCPWGTSHPKIVARKGFAAVGPAGSFNSCSTFQATLADGTIVTE
jgi:hypothetical protein